MLSLIEVEGPHGGHSYSCVHNKTIPIQFCRASVIKHYRGIRRLWLTVISISNCLDHDTVYFTINEVRDGRDLRHEDLAGPLCGSLTSAVLHSDTPSQSQSCNTVSKKADERRKLSNIGLMKDSDLEDGDDGRCSPRHFGSSRPNALAAISVSSRIRLSRIAASRRNVPQRTTSHPSISRP